MGPQYKSDRSLNASFSFSLYDERHKIRGVKFMQGLSLALPSFACRPAKSHKTDNEHDNLSTHAYHGPKNKC